uniref:Aminotran_5 domain-containing protein n=1 Tax=Macrostomum lignano TaxID=282301 RepID=A0A1I8JJ70_9PLAT
MSCEKFVEFGKSVLASDFPHVASTGVIMLNSGSFGLSPKSVIDKKIECIQDFESYGDNYVRQSLLRQTEDSIEAVAKLLDVRPDQCVIVDNVTTGISNLLDTIVRPGDTILVNSWTYGSVKMAASLSSEVMTNRNSDETDVKPSSVQVVELDIELPIKSEEDIIEQVRKTLEQRSDIRIAILDHITSSTACLMPVQQLTKLCRSRGVLVVIDGAHAIGQVPELDIESIGADFYVGNLHKWCFAPKSAALLWARADRIDSLRPSVVSWLVRDHLASMRFAFLGTRDTSSVCAVSEAVRFVKQSCGGLVRTLAVGLRWIIQGNLACCNQKLPSLRGRHLGIGTSLALRCVGMHFP